MLFHHVKIALRNILKHKGTSLISISGLAVGMACALLIFFWVNHQLTYDKEQLHRDQIYRLESSWVILPPYLKDTVSVFPEIEKAVRFYFWNEPTVRYGEKIFTLTDLAMVDDEVFDVFHFNFIEGNQQTALGNPNSIVLTRSIAKKLFGDEEALGKTILYNNSVPYTVTGVIEDIRKFHMRINAFASVFDIVRRGSEDFLTSRSFNFPLYLKIVPGADIKGLEEKINARVLKTERWEKVPLFLRPFKDIYFARNLNAEKNMLHGNIHMVIAFSIIAILILSIACINFVNLTVAKTSTREREIAVRKVSGASQRFLIFQFFGETFFIVLVSLAAALFLVVLFFPAFQSLVGEKMVLTLKNPGLQAILAGVVLFTVFLSGSYPAFYLAGLRPVEIMKGKSGQGRKNSGKSKILVAFQFAISVFLIISTLTVVRQLRYMQGRDLGVDYNQVLTFRVRGDRFSGDAESQMSAKRAFKQRLLSDPSVRGVSFLTQIPGKLMNTWTIYGNNEEDKFPLKVFHSDPDFIDLMGLEIKEGRNFSYDMPGGEDLQFILNEEAVNKLGISEPVGKFFHYGQSGRIMILGVVKNFHYNSLHTNIGPMAINWYRKAGIACVKITGSDISAAVRHIERVYKEFCPRFALEYDFLDDSFARLYNAEKQLERILTYFVFLAIGLSVLGLFALTAFMTERRTKEIGIRKVLGSSNAGIVVLFSRSFAKWILLANLLSWPAAFFVLQVWLQSFAYHINVGWLVFFFSGMLALGIAVLTIGYQALKAASSNPADCLRYE
ncbi:MAG: ABC transporter permease [Candidatus Aminicenantes bacterium]|nr:ABC transporter permease [Candidatus Aminicenantes bacterium]